MRTHILALLLFLGVSTSAFAQRFSLEAGVGIQPLHMSSAPGTGLEKQLADKGIQITDKDKFCPTFSLSGIWRAMPKNEFLLTVGLSWRRYQMTQYETFGKDPQGRPRYDLSKGQAAGSATAFVPSFTLRYRHFWSQAEKPLLLYSGLGVGFIPTITWTPMPELLPLGLRFNGAHFYGFVDLTVGPVATALHGGVGWKF